MSSLQMLKLRFRDVKYMFKVTLLDHVVRKL